MSKVLKYLARFIGAFGLFLILAPSAHAATNGRMIDDGVFDASGTMSANDIQTFLNGFPSGCLKSYTDDMPSADPTRAYFDYSGTGSAAQIIRRVADNYGINPRVLLTKLEQESSLISGGGGCQLWRQASAIGFKCFDGANPRTTTFRGSSIQTCVATDADMGVARQLSKGAWLLKWGKERANGNLNWMVPDDASMTYGGPMTQGSKKRCSACATVYYDGYWNGVYLESGATATLYNYTPYLNQAFDEIWEGWWGAGSTMNANYSYQLVTQWADKDLGGLPAGEEFTYYLRVKNTGNRTWSKTGPNPVRLGTTAPPDRVSSFCATTWISCYRPGVMQEATVAPGEEANFILVMKAPYQFGYQTQSFSLVAENIEWMNLPGVLWGITIKQPQLKAQYVSTTLPTTVTAGATINATITVKNTGDVTWYKNGGYPARLATATPNDRISAFVDPSWVSPTRIADLTDGNVSPNGNTTYTVRLKAPTINGAYNESFQLVVDGYSWFSSPAFSFPITVTGGTAQAHIPVYRLFNPKTGVHFYTADPAELDIVQQRYGYTLDGVAYYAHAQSGPGDIPIYRLFNPKTGVHFYTADPVELDIVRQRYGYTLDGVAYYAHAQAGAGDTPVYRLYNPKTGVHFYTADPVELDIVRQRYGYTLDGVAYYSVP